jgi:3-oxoacyl-[acyl-carrier-protein] synthase III
MECPIVVERRRIEIADPKIAGSKQPYHAAKELPLKGAEALVSACAEASAQLAAEAVREAIADAKQKGYEISTSCILTGSGRSIPDCSATRLRERA